MFGKGISLLAQKSPAERGPSAKHENTRRRKLKRQVYHSTAPFENPFDSLTVLSNVEGLRVLSPSAVSSGPNGIVEGLMALSETLSEVEGSKIEWAWF